MRETGRFVRYTARSYADALRRRFLLPEGHLPPDGIPPNERRHLRRQTRYDCAKTQAKYAKLFTGWQEWSVLPWLAELRERTGVRVALLNWPVAHEPVGACYNVRLPEVALREFNAVIRAEASRLNLPLLDLHDLLAPDDFFDSLHPRPKGQRKIAERLAPEIRALLPGRALRASAEASARP